MRSYYQAFFSILVFFLIIIVGYFGFNLYYQEQALSTFTLLADPEHEHPGRYLNTTGKYQRTFWGNKVNISGTVTNTAGHTNYKDVVVQLSFYSPTKSVIESINYVLYDYFTYGSTKEFKLKLPFPKGAVSCGWEVVGATFY